MSVKMTVKVGNSIQICSVAKTLMVLDVLAANQQYMSLAEIARVMKVLKSTLRSLLATMPNFSYIEQSSFDGRYRLGIRLLEMVNIVANNWDVRKVAGPYID